MFVLFDLHFPRKGFPICKLSRVKHAYTIPLVGRNLIPVVRERHSVTKVHSVVITQGIITALVNRLMGIIIL